MMTFWVAWREKPGYSLGFLNTPLPRMGRMEELAEICETVGRVSAGGRHWGLARLWERMTRW